MAAPTVDIAIIGAGPYGLSLAAHLRRTQRSFRIFGAPMDSWAEHMPRGMSLKSEGFASNLYDPDGDYPLKTYCAENHVDYADIGLPVRIETFIGYGREFQKRHVPALESAQATQVRTAGEDYEVTIDSGEKIRARQVVVAAGITHFGHLPPQLKALPDSLVSHSSRYSDVSFFKGRRVAVLGGGASAIDFAVLSQQAGAQVELIARRPAILFHDPPQEPRPLIERLKAPRSGLGLGWRSRLCSDIPLVFHAMPQSLRLKAVKSHLGPAPCWFSRDLVVGRLPMRLDSRLVGAREHAGGVRLTIREGAQGEREIDAQHVIAATGYQVDLSRLGFIDAGLRARIQAVAGSPVLNRQFESSLPGLYFVGLAAANSFGPLLRFAYGAGFTATRLSRHLVARTRSTRRAAKPLMESA